ncbi:MAG: winged helix-turn-helix transcriptional regulator, partial [Pseudomonadota bacterium]|nr:winged helix-turn-helix transcriptional regulator [Pseudomonadota bacterium]
MTRVKLDEIDLHILQDLQDKGRMTNVDLSRRIGISAPPCLRRVRYLEKNEVIRGYHADINPTFVGYTV